MKYLPVRQWGWRRGAAGGGWREGEERRRWRKGRKKNLTPHWLPIPCTFLREPKWKDTISLNEAGCKGRHKGDKIVQSRGHWHCLCCNYYTSFNTSAMQLPPTHTQHTPPSDKHEHISKRKGVHCHSCVVRAPHCLHFLRIAVFNELILLILDDKEQVCDPLACALDYVRKYIRHRHFSLHWLSIGE